MDSKNMMRDLFIVLAITLAGGTLVYTSAKDDALPETQEASTATSLETNKQTMPESDLKIEVTKEGTGESAVNGKTLLVHYTGTLEDGTVFDSSIPRGEPFPVRLGAGEVIRGWELGLLGMKVGEERTLTIPPELGYGKDGFPGVIPPSATLIFTVSLLAIQ